MQNLRTVSGSRQLIPIFSCISLAVTKKHALAQGGESEALARLAEQLSDKAWVAAFEKPKGDPAAFDPKPATTILSPYLKFGCISARLFYESLQQVRAARPLLTCIAPGAPMYVLTEAAISSAPCHQTCMVAKGHRYGPLRSMNDWQAFNASTSMRL